jgi:hypothetical protein
VHPDERRSLALTLGLLAICLVAYFFVFVPPSLVDLDRLSLSTNYDYQSFFLPKFMYGSDELRHFRFPLWNPYEYGGVPFFATAQPAVLYPPKALLFAFLRPDRAYWAFMALHFVGLAIGFVLFAREQGISGLPLFVGASTWVFATPILISNYHPTRIAVMVPVPFVFLLVERMARTVSVGLFLALSLLVALQFTAGYPEGSMDLGLLVGLHAVVRYVTKQWDVPPWRIVPVFAAAFVLAAGLAGVQLLPMIEAGIAANRLGVAKEVVGLSMAVPETFMAPKLGIVPLFIGFGFVALFTRRALPASAGFIMCSAIASGGWLLLRRLPGFGMIRFPYVWFLIGPFYAAWLAALGADAFLAPRSGRRREVWAVSLVSVVGVIWAGCCALYWKRAGTDLPSPAKVFSYVVNNIGTRKGAGLGVLAGLGLAAGALPVMRRRGGSVATGLPVVLSVLSHLAGYPYGARPAPVKRPGLEGEIKSFLNAGIEIQGRALSIDDIAYGYELTDRIPSVLGAEESFVPFRYRRILAEWHCVPMFGWFDWVAFATSRGFLDAMNVQYVSTPLHASSVLIGSDMRAMLRRKGSVLFENSRSMGHAWVNYNAKTASSADEALEYVLDPEFDPRSSVIVEDKLAWTYRYQGEESFTLPDSENRISPNEVEYTVTLPRNGILVASETFYPGWTATVDRYPATIIVADYVLRGVEVPPGTHRVRFAYRPKSVQYGIAVSLISMAFWVGLAAVRIMRRRRIGTLP